MAVLASAGFRDRAKKIGGFVILEETAERRQGEVIALIALVVAV
jgi:hypothetical protein